LPEVIFISSYFSNVGAHLGLSKSSQSSIRRYPLSVNGYQLMVIGEVHGA